MDYKELYTNDKEYQSIINEFKTAKAELERKSRYGTYKFDVLAEEGQGIFDKLRNDVRNHHTERLNETLNAIDRLETKDNYIGYADRPSEGKEFEMQYKLASDRELERMVQDLNTDDMLQISLLRMELKDRGMEDQESLVRRYIIQNDVGGRDEEQQKEYEARKKAFATYSTMGSDRNVIIDGELKSLNNIEKELWNIAKQTDIA